MVGNGFWEMTPSCGKVASHCLCDTGAKVAILLTRRAERQQKPAVLFIATCQGSDNGVNAAMIFCLSCGSALARVEEPPGGSSTGTGKKSYLRQYFGIY